MGLIETEPSEALSVVTRVAGVDWDRVGNDLDQLGCAIIGPLLTGGLCRAIVQSYETDALFRTRIIMARHGFGRGEYKYFAYPLPARVVGDIARHFIRTLAPCGPTAGTRRWGSLQPIRPTTKVSSAIPHGKAPHPRRCCCSTGWEILTACTKTFYGEHIFPLQVAFLLSGPGA